MPHKHTIKTFVAGSFYHVYNRGVNKNDIFHDDQDYRVFLHLLKYYLSPIETLEKTHPLLEDILDVSIVRPRPLSNLEKEVDLVAYCLMPNHFHLLLRQHTVDGMTRLMRRLSTTYALYMNKRYHRVGYLFQGRYKGAIINEEPYLLHLSRYIHINPLDLQGMTRTNLVNYSYSSYSYYIGIKHAVWIKPQFIIGFFHQTKSSSVFKNVTTYRAFVENENIKSPETIKPLTLDETE